MSETLADLTIVRSHEPSVELARAAQHIGYAAWRARFSTRTSDQVAHVFNPGDERSKAKLLARMHSKVGQFASVVAKRDGRPIGYGWAADDVGTMPEAEQRAKIMEGVKPLVWVAQLNVLPTEQARGIGSAMLRELLRPFDEAKPSSTYVFDENHHSLAWFSNRRYVAIPDQPYDPNEDTSVGSPDMYFGEGARHVLQWRLEAESVGAVIRATMQRVLLPLDYEVVDQ